MCLFVFSFSSQSPIEMTATMDRGIESVILLTAEVLMISWYTLEVVARKCTGHS